ncbi:MAG: aminotransferase class I/II-fold pyridoxal phosphate-dependent enzyme [Undibacterium sp.]|nr:aminotransferase class I/II-fold pyridoxal phosphate-dependent enzyme [Undibacterium sp.]
MLTEPPIPSYKTPEIHSKLPQVKTTIFTRMSALANEHKAINLGQGFPDFQCDEHLLDAVTGAMKAGHNQYPPMAGTLALRLAIANKTQRLYQASYDVDHEITVTAGATQAILSIILATVSAGDEVIVIEPAYDCYLPAIQLAGGIPVLVSMQYSEGRFSIDWAQIGRQINAKTKLLIINSPSNPTGMCLAQSDLHALADLVRDTNLLILSDEVYEHMVFDGQSHESICAHAELASRSFVVSSFGKTYHVTGWKVGYVLAPKSLTLEFRKVHQFNVFTVNTPMQIGIAQYMEDAKPYLELPKFYQDKRDYFQAGLMQTPFKLLPVAGTYFQTVDYSAISDLNEFEFASWLTTEIGVTAIPVSAFYQQQIQNKLVRFCFAKREETMDAALARLRLI